MPALDGLRGIAILLVLFTHAALGRIGADAAFMMTTHDPTFILPKWLETLAGSAANGVTLFFVISAFTLAARAEGWSRLGAYALRRLARVGPGFWLAGLCYTGIALLAASPTITRLSPSDFLIAASFVGAWVGGDALGIVPGGWSISCEVAFYAALPVLLWLIQGRLWRALAVMILTIAAAQLRYRHISLAGSWSLIASVHPIMQAPVFVAGIVALLAAQRMGATRRPWIALAVLGFAIVAIPYSGYAVSNWFVMRHILFAVCAAFVVASCAVTPPRVLASLPMRSIGEVSYSMYLVHFALLNPSLRIAIWLRPAADTMTMLVHFAMTSAASFAVACLTYRLVERPAIAWAARQTGARTMSSLATATGSAPVSRRR